MRKTNIVSKSFSKPVQTGVDYTRRLTGSYISVRPVKLIFDIYLRCQVILWNGDALALCTSGLPSESLFDVIDTSNVSDHIGLLNVLVCCAPRLKLYVKKNFGCCYCNFLNTTRRLIALRVVDQCVT